MIPQEIAPKSGFYSLRPVVMSRRGMVVAGTPLAAHAGGRMLVRGGNAIDAAIAAAAVQAVVMPHLNGLGGDMFLLYARSNGEVMALNASGPAPAGATLDAFRTRGLKAVPIRGIEAVSVPGAVDGWFRALRDFGRLRWTEVFEPALEYAKEGFPVHKNFARFLTSPAFQALEWNPGLAETYLRDGHPPRAGELLIQAKLANTLERLIRKGADDFYRGETAEQIIKVASRLGGFLTRDDLGRYESRWAAPISVSYRGLTVYQVPPNSQGVTMLQQLRALEVFEVGSLGHNTPEYIHLLAEAKKDAFTDRGKSLADPEVVPVPVGEMLSTARASAFKKVFDPRRASRATRAGTRRTRGGTTCVVAVDDEGNAVSLIQSVFEDFGSGVFVEEAGFVLQNRMCGFTLEPDHPNVVAPRKRPMHTLCCSLVARGNRLLLTYATPGGHAQTQTLVQVLNNIFVFGMDVQEAIEAPRFTHEGDQLLLESRIPRDIRVALARRGHTVAFLPEWSSVAGGCAAIAVDQEAGTRQGGADPRRDSYAVAA